MTQIVEVKSTVIVEITATPPPISRKGAWVDKVIFTSIDWLKPPSSSCRLVTSMSMPTPLRIPAVRRRQGDPDLAYSHSFGSYTEMTFNPAVFTDGRLNPFSNPKIREAMNWLIDRNYVVQEIYGGLANAEVHHPELGLPGLLPSTWT